jgi:hypothetical protein
MISLVLTKALMWVLPADPNGRPVAIALDTVGYFLPSSFARPLI